MKVKKIMLCLLLVLSLGGCQSADQNETTVDMTKIRTFVVSQLARQTYTDFDCQPADNYQLSDFVPEYELTDDGFKDNQTSWFALAYVNDKPLYLIHIYMSSESGYGAVALQYDDSTLVYADITPTDETMNEAIGDSQLLFVCYKQKSIIVNSSQTYFYSKMCSADDYLSDKLAAVKSQYKDKASIPAVQSYNDTLFLTAVSKIEISDEEATEQIKAKCDEFIMPQIEEYANSIKTAAGDEIILIKNVKAYSAVQTDASTIRVGLNQNRQVYYLFKNKKLAAVYTAETGNDGNVSGSGSVIESDDPVYQGFSLTDRFATISSYYTTIVLTADATVNQEYFDGLSFRYPVVIKLAVDDVAAHLQQMAGYQQIIL